MTIHVAGLGPADSRLVTSGTLELLRSGHPVILRTRHHPAAAELDPGGAWLDCDDLYATGAGFADVYRTLAERVLAHPAPVVFAVPGNPLVAERSVQHLLALAEERGINVVIHPAVSYVDVAAVALRRDLAGVQLCDAAALRIDTWRPALIAQVHDRDSASSTKLALLEWYPPAHQVACLRALGTADESVDWLPLDQLDHRPWSYLDTLFVPAIEPLVDLKRFDGLDWVVRRLHAPDGCPWDREQTHSSLQPHLLEEAYELLEAIDRDDPAAITEELGDVLLQVLMHGAVGEREGTFTLADVYEHIARKLVSRHPHVFGERTAATAEEVYRNWDALKKAERPGRSSLDGVPASMPALAASQAIQGRARRVGFDWPDIDGPLEKLREEVAEFAVAPDAANRIDEFGDILFVLTNIADHLGIDAEGALRGANAKFRRRFAEVERLAAERDLDLGALDLAALDRLWDEAKATDATA